MRTNLVIAVVVGAVLAIAPASAAEQAPGGTFVDDDGIIHEAAIESMVLSGITAGCGTDPARYCPDRPVTREQMARFLVRALGLPAAVESNRFVDDDGSPFEADIDALAEAGITTGCSPDGTLFCPGAEVTRAEMASFLVRAYDEDGSAEVETDVFDDDDGTVYEADIDRLAALGITAGCGERAYCPGEAVTRAEMATFIARASGVDLLPPPPPRPPQELVHSFTTFHACCESRVTNIHVMADAMDGAIVWPGQTFSINEYLGRRTEAQGYVPAGILLDGELYCCDHPLNIGGGTSQFATTFYNTIFWGGYEIIEHKPHSRYISRYPLGIEATLGWTWPDVVFRNDTPTPIEFRTGYTSTSITVELWGNANGRTVTADVQGSATYSGGGSVVVTRSITERDGAVRAQTWDWTYLSG